MTQEEAEQLFRSEPERYVDVGSTAAAYRKVGTGPDVLFVHGWPAHGATFRRLLPHLVDHVTCHLIDMPGTGSSQWTSPGALSIDNHVKTVRRVVDELQLTGTKSEVHLAWLNKRPLLPLTGTGGWSDNLEADPPDERKNAPILSWGSVDTLVANFATRGFPT